jgi:CRISPR/Cas system Type II protein with McrA/HNH and RuvC-like nuclease domain
MSDTPETDAAEYLISIGRKNDEWLVQSEFARKLERERDEARSELVKVENERDHWKKIASAFEVLMPPVGGKRILKIIERDGWKCAYCGVETCFNGWDGPMPTVDHITPKAKGGLDHIANCVVACKDCNSAKSDQEDWSPNSGEQKEKNTWAWEDGKFRKRNW